jgi:hypothetical protein
MFLLIGFFFAGSKALVAASDRLTCVSCKERVTHPTTTLTLSLPFNPSTNIVKLAQLDLPLLLHCSIFTAQEGYLRNQLWLL